MLEEEEVNWLAVGSILGVIIVFCLIVVNEIILAN